MTATAHALVGGAIAVSVRDPVLGITLATLSHPLLDMVPHWDFGVGWRNKNRVTFLAEGVFDLGIGLFLSYILFGKGVNPIYFFGAIFASLFLDFAQLPYWFFKWKFPPFSWAYQIQHIFGGRTTLGWGIINQALVVSLVVIFLKIV